MSKSSVIVNGENTSEVGDFTSDANINMVAAINEHSCSKHLETFNSKDSGGAILTYPCDFDHMYASNMNDSANTQGGNSEISHLKELLLIHLDLIQQQSEQLVTKDKQIAALKQENDTLKQRLERMDRRVTLQKHKELSEVLTSQTSVPASPVFDSAPQNATVPTTSSENLSQEVSVNNMYVSESDNTNTGNIFRKRKREDGADSSVCSGSAVVVASKRNRSASWTSSVTSTDVTPTFKVNGRSAKREIIQRRERTRRRRARNKGNNDMAGKKIDNIITTDTPYYTPVGDSNNTWNMDAPQLNGCVLEVPSWRVKVFTSCYTMEGTENLSDDVFDRRHSRLELDERRRKRWDVQRIREQRQLEKLRQRERKGEGGGGGGGGGGSSGGEGGLGVRDEEEELVSLWPSPDDAQFLQVEDVLPVAAFGCPITKFSNSDSPSEFSLPWVSCKDGRGTVSYMTRRKR